MAGVVEDQDEEVEEGKGKKTTTRCSGKSNS